MMASCLVIWPKSDYISSNLFPGNVSWAGHRITGQVVSSRHVMLPAPLAGWEPGWAWLRTSLAILTQSTGPHPVTSGCVLTQEDGFWALVKASCWLGSAEGLHRTLDFCFPAWTYRLITRNPNPLTSRMTKKMSLVSLAGCFQRLKWKREILRYVPSHSWPLYWADVECGKATNKRRTWKVNWWTQLLLPFPFVSKEYTGSTCPTGLSHLTPCLPLSCPPRVTDKPEPDAFTKCGRDSPRQWLSLIRFGCW